MDTQRVSFGMGAGPDKRLGTLVRNIGHGRDVGLPGDVRIVSL